MKPLSGFGLIGLLITVAIIALLVFGGGRYASSIKQKQNTIQQGVEAEKMAEQVKLQVEQNNKQIK
ncbi:MAG: hypothetical protein AAB482_02585 [Patescibacteria group bacterium]